MMMIIIVVVLMITIIVVMIVYPNSASVAASGKYVGGWLSQNAAKGTRPRNAIGCGSLVVCVVALGCSALTGSVLSVRVRGVLGGVNVESATM